MAQASVATIIDTNPKRIGAAAGQQDLRASKRFKRMHLGSIAATDAHHDFKKSGRTGGAFGFSPDAFCRDTNAVKTIGTPFNPFARELMSEYEVLDMFIPFIIKGGKFCAENKVVEFIQVDNAMFDVIDNDVLLPQFI